jgi:superfamily II DNA or RNA helicase
MNETWTGLSRDGNLESVDVAANWMGARDLERVRTEEAYFADLWFNKYPNLRVLPFPAVARDELLRAADPDWEKSLDQILEDSEPQRRQHNPDSRGRVLRPHQADGLSSWSANDRKGILAFATGSGKTFTAITAIREAVTKLGDTILLVVPDRVLFDQWFREIRETTADIGLRILRAGAGNDNWRNHLELWTSPGELPRLVLATARTACSSDFRNRLAGGTHLMLVADEVHRLGSPRNSQILDEEAFGARLGLSATPERAGDPVGTEKILSFFRGILAPRYELTDAIRDLVLTKYFYRPHTVQLSEEEADDWHEITVRIGQLTARIEGRDSSRPQLEARRDGLYIRRARIVKHAAAKVPLAVKVLRSEYKRGQKWIVYCEDLMQLNAVSKALNNSGVPVLPFHSKMMGSREETLRWLDRRGGVVAAIKCLDEGVDVPSVTHALILASSKNPREFTQRRGRVLRTAPGKSLAFVHDAIVLPPGGDVRSTDPITAGELARAVQFAESADNPAAASDLQQIAVSLNINWRSLQNKGIEDAED